jgi:hypothetical protein
VHARTIQDGTFIGTDSKSAAIWSGFANNGNSWVDQVVINAGNFVVRGTFGSAIGSASASAGKTSVGWFIHASAEDGAAIRSGYATYALQMLDRSRSELDTFE